MRTYLVILTYILSVGCTKELPIGFERFNAQPVLQGSLSTLNGINLSLTNTLAPSQELQEIGISGARIITVSSNGNTIEVPEYETGKYKSDNVPLSTDESYVVMVKHPNFQDIITDDIRFVNQPSSVKVTHQFNEVSRVLNYTVHIDDEKLEDRWFWIRFADGLAPRFTDFENEQDITLCQGENATSSNSIIFSSSCALDGSIDVGFSSHFFRDDTLVTHAILEIAHIDRAYAELLMSQSLLDYEFYLDEPPPPRSNTNTGIGFVGSENIDTINIDL